MSLILDSRSRLFSPGKSIRWQWCISRPKDDVPEEVSEWDMDLAYDMDGFFRQHALRYAAEHPEKHAAKEVKPGGRAHLHSGQEVSC